MADNARDRTFNSVDSEATNLHQILRSKYENHRLPMASFLGFAPEYLIFEVVKSF
jgi:hypothetical protein